MYRRLSIETLRLEEEGLTHISGPARGLRQLAGTTQIQPLEIFAGTLQPVDFHVRSSQQHPSTLTVFDHLVDAVRPDPPLRHQFEMLVDAALRGGAGDIERLDSIFHSWVDNGPALDRMAAGSPLLQEASQHIAVWPKLGSLGLDALSYIRSGKAPPAGWQAAQTALLDDANKPQELVDFVVLGPPGRLVTAAAH